MSTFDRNSGIGASESPKIMGIAPAAWGSALEVYLQKIGELPPKESTDEMRLGNHLEDGIRAAVAERLGVAIRKPNTIQHPAIPYIYASPDGLLEAKAGRAGFEAKIVGSPHAGEWGDEGTDEVPDYVNVQCQQQMCVFGLERVYVGALIWGSLKIYPIDRENEAIGLILEACAEFWGRVQQRNPPPPDWTNPHTARIVQAMHRPSGAVAYATADEAAALRVLLDVREVCGAAEKQAKLDRDAAQAKITEIMGVCGEVIMPDGTSITRRTIERAAYTVEAGSYVRFSVKYPKKRPDGKAWGHKKGIEHGDADKGPAAIIAAGEV